MKTIVQLKIELRKAAGNISITRENYKQVADSVIPRIDFPPVSDALLHESPEKDVLLQVRKTSSDDWLDISLLRVAISQLILAAEKHER